jgi:methyl-accepting chemotaxis protein
VKEAEEIFRKITASIHEIVDNNVQIATGAEQQRQVVEGVDCSLASVKGHGEFNACEAKRMVQASAEVTEMLSRLNQLVSKFRVG